MEQNQSNHIYEQIQQQITHVIQEIAQQQDQSIGEEVRDSLGNLYILNAKIQQEYEKLKKFSEWKRFTIAFYGETNAGKSTLIEALRLALKEPTKVETQKRFIALQQEIGVTQESFDLIRKQILEHEESIKQTQSLLIDLKQQFVENQQEAKSSIIRCEKSLQKAQAQQSFVKRILTYLRLTTLPEEKELIQARQNLVKLNSEYENQNRNLNNQLKELGQLKQIAEMENQRLSEEVEKLVEYADGTIIGDGRSDFTRENTFFNFSLGTQEFTLIDVPGIEGNEAIVNCPIEEAVKKAHAVFYVTRAPRAPQTQEGEQGERKGTLEKIKEHLGSQTEVWAIYNHPVNNPRQLRNPLLDENTLLGLQDMDEKLKETLNDHYCGNIVLSARPAYLASTSCIIPGRKESSEQKKLLEKFSSTEEILSLSGFNRFVSLLQNEIIGDYRNKINHSNLNKASIVLKEALDILYELKQKFAQTERKVRSELNNTKSQIDVLLIQFSGSLKASSSKVLRQFQSEVRDQVYEKINEDIDNDDFKRYLKSSLEEKSKILEQKFRANIERENDLIAKELERITQRTAHHLKQIVQSQAAEPSLKEFPLSINIDNGINKWGLAGSATGIALGIVALATNPVGWSVAFIGGVVALLSSLVSVTKSIWGFFDSDYKKSQQRKAIDENIKNIGKNFNEHLNETVEVLDTEMKKCAQEIKSGMDESIKQCATITESLQKAEYALSNINQTIFTHNK